MTERMKKHFEKVNTHIRSDIAIRSISIFHHKVSKLHNVVPVSKLMNIVSGGWSLPFTNNIAKEHNETQSRQ